MMLYVCVHMHKSILLHVHTEARGQWKVPFLYLPPSLFGEAESFTE